MTLGEKIVFFRNKSGLTQKALAEKMDISSTRLNYWEKDKRLPDVLMLNRLCVALDVSPNDMFYSSETIENPPAPAEPEQGEDEAMRAFAQVLVSAGLIEEGFQLTDRDTEFLGNALRSIDMWIEERKKNQK